MKPKSKGIMCSHTLSHVPCASLSITHGRAPTSGHDTSFTVAAPRCDATAAGRSSRSSAQRFVGSSAVRTATDMPSAATRGGRPLGSSSGFWLWEVVSCLPRGSDFSSVLSASEIKSHKRRGRGLGTLRLLGLTL